jgi:hypothetical protein
MANDFEDRINGLRVSSMWGKIQLYNQAAIILLTDLNMRDREYSARTYRPSFRENKPKTEGFGIDFAKTGSINSGHW